MTIAEFRRTTIPTRSRKICKLQKFVIRNLLLTLLHIVLISGLAWLLWRKEIPTLRQIFWPAIVVKLAAGACLGLLYTYYFPVGDTFVYFNDASRVADLARQDLWFYLKFYRIEMLADGIDPAGVTYRNYSV